MFFGFSGEKTQQIWVSQEIRFRAFCVPGTSNLSARLSFFSFGLAGIKELTWESFVEFFYLAGKHDRFENADMSTFQQI